MNIWDYLGKIREGLEQIDNITQNQMTLITSDSKDNETLDFMENMIKNKEELMNELDEYEKLFQNEYNKQRDILMKNGEIKEIKKKVEQILELKELIVQHEKSNLMAMQAKSSKKEKVLSINPTASQVVAAYKRQSEI